MYQIQALIARWLAELVYAYAAGPRVVEVIREVVVVEKDPNGLILNDMKKIEQWMPDGTYKVGESLEAVAYRQGMFDLYRMIREKLITRR